MMTIVFRKRQGRWYCDDKRQAEAVLDHYCWAWPIGRPMVGACIGDAALHPERCASALRTAGHSVVFAE